MLEWAAAAGAAVAAVVALRALHARLRLARAKHRSLEGHPRWAKRLARLVPFYEFDEETIFSADGAPLTVARQRRAALQRLGNAFDSSSPHTLSMSEELETGLSDLQFTARYRVPFPYRRVVSRYLRIGALLEASSDIRVRNLDGRSSYDLSGSYGVNLFGYDFYKDCIDQGIARVRALGPVLGS